MAVTQTPVLVVGGGTVGLCAAAFLHAQGVPTVLVERHPGTSVLPRARIVNVRSMELLRGLGLEAIVRATPGSVFAERPLAIRAETLAGPEISRVERQPAAVAERYSPGGAALIDQNVLEPLLFKYLVDKSVDLRFSTELVSFEADVDGVTALLTDRAAARDYRLRCQYLIAADGHRSGIRRSLGIEFPMRGSISHVVTMIFEADLTGPLAERPVSLCYLNNPEPGTLLTPFDSADRWVLMVPYHPESGESATNFSENCCLRLIDDAVGLPVSARLVPPLPGSDRLVLSWELGSRVAASYRSGRVFLVGDAAHVMPPSGGFGANTGIAEAHNLAWKLAAVLRGAAGDALLDSYERERRPIAEATCASANGVLRSRHSGRVPPVDPLAVALGYSYGRQGGSVFQQPSALSGEPGTRAPHVVLERAGEPISTLDLFGPDWMVLTGSSNTAASARAAGIDALCVGVDLRDVTGCWAATFGIRPDGAVLVRPDGFIGWRTDSVATDGQIAAAKARLLSS